MSAEREPAVHQQAQLAGRHAKHSRWNRYTPGGQVDALFIPRAESASPAPRHVHLRDHGFFTTAVALQIDDAVEEHPPAVGMITLPEQLDARLDGDFFTRLDELRKLLIGQALKQA